MTKFIPDCYWPSVTSGQEYVSHEAVCVLNTGKAPATILLTLYFEDRDKLDGFTVKVDPERTTHIRLDKLVNERGETVPRGVPYAMRIDSDVDVSLQYTRVDTSQPELAIATTIL